MMEHPAFEPATTVYISKKEAKKFPGEVIPDLDLQLPDRLGSGTVNITQYEPNRISLVTQSIVKQKHWMSLKNLAMILLFR